MSEINNTPANNQDGLGGDREAKLLRVITELEGRIEEHKLAEQSFRSQIEFLGAAVMKWSNTWERVRTSLNEFFEEGDLNEGSPLDDWLIEEFNLDVTEEHDVTYTCTWSGTVTVKKGADLSDLLKETDIEWDFDVQLDGETVGNLSLDGGEFDY